MTKQLFKELFIWGFILWLVGYVLGIMLFILVPQQFLGWVIMPIGVLITLWVVKNKVKSDSLRYWVVVGVVWCLIAMACDYVFLVKLFKPTDGYYKLDVYLYYVLTLTIPILVGLRRSLIKKLVR